MRVGLQGSVVLKHSCGRYLAVAPPAVILVDTSVWIDHLRTGDERLIDLLDSSQVLTHPFVIGELACGNLQKRDDVIRLLNDLPEAPVASHEEVLYFIESNKLMGQGVGRSAADKRRNDD